ncbi:MAG: hypothetical protein HC933_19550 [Pleurocapsa sp. SU_196_0]|nr:hypothetical protein [Pleurocapsa sp. SU_196_0]
MKRWLSSSLAVSSVLVGLSVVLAQGGGSITGFVTVPAKVQNLEKLVVLACAKADPMCLKPAQVVSLAGKTGIAVKDARKIPYSLVRLPAGEYFVYALNDKNDNLQHDFETEELGGYFKDGTFDPILVTPPARTVNFDLIPLE